MIKEVGWFCNMGKTLLKCSKFTLPTFLKIIITWMKYKPLVAKKHKVISNWISLIKKPWKLSLGIATLKTFKARLVWYKLSRNLMTWKSIGPVLLVIYDAVKPATIFWCDLVKTKIKLELFLKFCDITLCNSADVSKVLFIILFVK